MEQLAVENFLTRYAACLDDEQWQQWPQLFDPEGSTYEVLSRENVDLGLPLAIMGCYSHGMIRDRVAMLIKNTLTYRRMYLQRQVSNVLITDRLPDGRLAVRANLLVHQSSPEGVSSLYIVARYRFELRTQGPQWLITRMQVVVDSFGIDTMLAVPL